MKHLLYLPILFLSLAFSQETITFEYTGEVQEFIVPHPGVYTFELLGASGWNGSNSGGLGGYSSGELTLIDDEVLYIYVGGEGTVSTGSGIIMGGGWNGGGDGMSNSSGSYTGGGGGASDIRIGAASMFDRVIVAGGGGGSTNNGGCCGGNGGGLIGDPNCDCGYSNATGGTQTEGGYYGGEFGHGGNAESWMEPWIGGGGGGWYGGGTSTQHSGAGGGSSYIDGVNNGYTESGENEGNGYVVITLPPPSYFTINNQEVAAGQTSVVPVNFNLHIPDVEVTDMVFSVEVTPIEDAPPIEGELGIYVLDTDAEVVISENAPGYASVILSGFDPALATGDHPAFISILVPVPESAETGHYYNIELSNASAIDAEYNDVPIGGASALLAVSEFNNAPEITGLTDQYLLEDSDTTVFFNVFDPDGHNMTVELTVAPEYVSLNHESPATEGSISISPGFGAESGQVVVSVTDDDYLPRTTLDTFYVSINHYPTYDAPDSYYVVEESADSLEISTFDTDGDQVVLQMDSAPDYVSYNPSDTTLANGTLSITPYEGAESGYVCFTFTDDGNPTATVSPNCIHIIVNHFPGFGGLTDFHVPEEDVLDTLITFFDDDDGQEFTYEVLYSPDYVSWETYGDNEGVVLHISPTSSSISDSLTLSLSDPGGFNTQQTVNISVYETYLASDVRPQGDDLNGDGDSDDAGEFGNDNILASDVINALKISTGAESIPDSSSSLHDAFDSSPLDNDVNGDGDVYDLEERGGDGYIEAADVIVSLKRATMVPGFENVRRVDNNYPYSSRFSDRNSRSLDPTDMLVLGSVEASPGETVEIPVTLVRGESEAALTGLVSGFTVTHESGLELPEELEFIESVECMKIDVPTGNDILSLLMMDIEEQTARSELLLGHVVFTVPENAVEGDIFTFSSQGESGSTSSYETIVFLEGIDGVVTVAESSMVGDINFDGTVNVQDIIVMINIILPPGDDYTDEALQAADLNGDGLVNILDVMIVVNIILSDDMGRVAPADKATLYFGNNSVSYNANGAVAGFQLGISGEYEITNSTLQEGWEMHYSEGTVVIFSMDGSSLESSTLFEYTGDMSIESIIVSDIEGNAIPASSVIVPSKYALESAYPNPFNPVTTLNFSLPESQEVILQVYNLQGRVIETLVNSNMEAGYHSVQWNADNHASGVYFVKMIAGEYVDTQKLMLIK